MEKQTITAVQDVLEQYVGKSVLINELRKELKTITPIEEESLREGGVWHRVFSFSDETGSHAFYCRFEQNTRLMKVERVQTGLEKEEAKEEPVVNTPSAPAEENQKTLVKKAVQTINTFVETAKGGAYTLHQLSAVLSVFSDVKLYTQQDAKGRTYYFFKVNPFYGLDAFAFVVLAREGVVLSARNSSPLQFAVAEKYIKLYKQGNGDKKRYATLIMEAFIGQLSSPVEEKEESVSSPFVRVSVMGVRADKLIGGSRLDNPSNVALKEQFKTELLKQAQTRPVWAISNMSTGVDTIFAQAVLELKKEYPQCFFLEAAVPFKGQEEKWPIASKTAYYELLKKADKQTLITNDTYQNRYYRIASDYLVRQTDVLLAVTDGLDPVVGRNTAFAKRLKREVVEISVGVNVKATV